MIWSELYANSWTAVNKYAFALQRVLPTFYPAFIVCSSVDPGWIQPCSLWSPLEEIWWALRRPWPPAAASLSAAHQRLLFWELLWAEACRPGRRQACAPWPRPQATPALSAPLSAPPLPPNQTGEGAGSSERRGRLLDTDAPLYCSEDVQSLVGCLSLCLYGVGRLEFLPSVAVHFWQRAHTFAPAMAGGSQIVPPDGSGHSQLPSQASGASTEL